jgi:hypothetical protein
MFVMSQDVNIAVITLDLEVTMVWRYPAIANLRDCNTPLAKKKNARFFLAAMPRIALHHQPHSAVPGVRSTRKEFPNRIRK